MKRLITLFLSIVCVFSFCIPAFALSDSNSKDFGPKMTIQSNTWIENFCTISGNSDRWEYKVSAKYFGDKNNVQYIKTEWYAYAVMRKSAKISIGVSVSSNKEISASATKESKWQLVKTPKRYYQNNAKYTIADWSDTLVINSHKNYDAGTKGITNAAYVKVHGDNKVYTISSTV